MSILVITTMTGTLSASAIPKCSLSRAISSGKAGWRAACVLAHANKTIVGSNHE